MQRVFVLNADKVALMPCHPARARALLRGGRAAVYRCAPFTIILKEQNNVAVTQPVEIKADPGSKTTGLALNARFENRGWTTVWAANLDHRGHAIKSGLDDRRGYRRGRRARKTRYRKPRFNNRRRPEGWLPPSVQSRVDNVATWVLRLQARAPISEAHVETTRFDVHSMSAGRKLEGVEYQQGTLFGAELREYLLHRHHHTCAYCNGLSGDPVLEREHVVPKSRGGSDRIANQAVACTTCNQAKGNRTAGEWAQALAGARSKLDQARARNAARLQAGERPSLRDAAALNATRYAVGRTVQALGLPTRFWSGGRTKFNRMAQGYTKDHWLDAACVGESGVAVAIPAGLQPLQITAQGRGSRRMCRPDKYGFPRAAAKAVKRVHDFQTGDRVRLRQPGGKYKGVYVGRVSVRERGDFDVVVVRGGVKTKITAPHHRFQQLQRNDGYGYAA